MLCHCRATREQDNTIFLKLLSRSCKFLKKNSRIGLVSQYEKYYSLVLKFLIISFLITPSCLGLRILEMIDSLMVYVTPISAWTSRPPTISVMSFLNN